LSAGRVEARLRACADVAGWCDDHPDLAIVIGRRPLITGLAAAALTPTAATASLTPPAGVPLETIRQVPSRAALASLEAKVGEAVMPLAGSMISGWLIGVALARARFLRMIWDWIANCPAALADKLLTPVADAYML